MSSNRGVLVRVPAPRREMAKAYQKEYYARHQIELPLWRCLVEIEKREQRSPVDPFVRLKRGLRL